MSTFLVIFATFFILLANSLILKDEVGILHIEDDSKLDNTNGRRSMLSSPNVLSTSDKQELLDAHNLWRTVVANGSSPNQPEASNMNYLFWDKALASTASDYAKKCLWTHNSNRVANVSKYSDSASFVFDSGSGVGENLYMTSVNTISSVSSLVSGIKSWYNEYTSYTYSSTYQSAAGHYTQVVWANTRYIGCGYYECPSVTVSGDTGYYSDGAVILVCNYYPAGNWGGQYPYKSNSTCSQCDADRTRCVDSQCGGCLSSSFNYDDDITSDDCNNGLGVNVSGKNSNNGSSTSSSTSTTIAVVIVVLLLVFVGVFIGLNYKYRWIKSCPCKNNKNNNSSKTQSDSPFKNTTISHAISIETDTKRPPPLPQSNTNNNNKPAVPQTNTKPPPPKPNNNNNNTSKPPPPLKNLW